MNRLDTALVDTSEEDSCIIKNDKISKKGTSSKIDSNEDSEELYFKSASSDSDYLPKDAVKTEAKTVKKSSNQNLASKTITKEKQKLPSLYIIINKYVKSKSKHKTHIATEFLVSLIEYSGFPRIEVDSPIFNKLKSEVVNRSEAKEYKISPKSFYIKNGSVISKVLRNFLKKSSNLASNSDLHVPRLASIPNIFLDLVLCLMCVGFREIRKFVSLLLDYLLKSKTMRNRLEGNMSDLLYLIIDLKSQDIVSEIRVRAYHMLVKYVATINADATAILSRGLKDPSIQVRRVAMASIVEMLKFNKNNINVVTILDITKDRFIKTDNSKDRADIPKFWTSILQCTELTYPLEEAVLLVKNSKNCTPVFNKFLKEYLSKKINILPLTDSKASEKKSLNLSSNSVFSLENFQSLFSYILQSTQSVDSFNDIELGIFTCNLISATSQSFSFILDLRSLIDLFKMIEDFSKLYQVDEKKVCIIMFSILKQSVKCIFSSSAQPESARSDVSRTLLVYFKFLSERSGSYISYTLLLESLSCALDSLDSILYSMSEYVEESANVIFSKLTEFDQSSSIYIYSLICLQKFSSFEKIEAKLIKFIESNQGKGDDKNVFIMAHIARTLNWKYIQNTLHDTHKICSETRDSSSLALLYATFESGVDAKLKGHIDSLDILSQLDKIRLMIYQIGFLLLKEQEDYPLQVVVVSVILMTLRLENLIVTEELAQYKLSDEEESILSMVFFRVFNKNSPLLQVQKSIFSSLITYKLPVDNLERKHYWDQSVCTVSEESSASALAKRFTDTLNANLYGSSLGTLLVYNICSKDKYLAACCREFCIFLLKTNKILLYDLLLCLITFQLSDSQCDDVINEKQLMLIDLVSVFVELTEQMSNPKDIKRFIQNAVEYGFSQSSRHSEFILRIIKLFIKPSFISSMEWDSLKRSLEISLVNTPYSNLVKLLENSQEVQK